MPAGRQEGIVLMMMKKEKMKKELEKVCRRYEYGTKTESKMPKPTRVSLAIGMRLIETGFYELLMQRTFLKAS